jgi:hypothetical protein
VYIAPIADIPALFAFARRTSNMPDAVEYQRQADRCRRMAHNSSDEAMRLRLLELAQEYEGQARPLEA